MVDQVFPAIYPVVKYLRNHLKMSVQLQCIYYVLIVVIKFVVGKVPSN